jgi:lipoprotein-anchoring transpeptidase ErfK/SrfK
METRFGHASSQMQIHATELQTGSALTIGRTDDLLEREAEEIAGNVMGALPAQHPTPFAPPARPDFSQVRVHTNTPAAASARAVNALAYTVGQNIVFGTGQYAPTTNAGRHLLAHELVHAVQQDGGLGLHRLQRQEGPQGPTGEVPGQELGPEPEGDEEDEVEDGDTEVLNLDTTPDIDLEPHGPEPQVIQEFSPPLGADLGQGQIGLGILPTGKIQHIDVDQVSQRMVITFRGGQTLTHIVSTGRGNCGTAGDPCPTQKERHCTPNGTFTIVSRGNANTKNSTGDAMAWFVGLNVPGRQGIGIHDSQIADGTPRSHGCVRVGISEADKNFAKMINEHVMVGKTDVTISGKAKTKAYPCPNKKKAKP